MARIHRPVIGVNRETGEVKKWDSAYACSRELGVIPCAASQALQRNGCCAGWRLYDSVEYIDNLIVELENRREEVFRLEERICK